MIISKVNQNLKKNTFLCFRVLIKNVPLRQILESLKNKLFKRYGDFQQST